jgi:uncharacterized RDD family membrane protein YckC
METPTRPGWYDDPENPQQLRYFDGVIWTRHTTPRSTPRPPQESAPRPPTAPGGVPAQAGPPAYPGQQPPTPQGWPGQYPAQGGWSAPPAGYPYRPVPTTPDGQPLASWWKRVAARLMDWVIVWFCALPLTAFFMLRGAQELRPALEDYLRQIEAGNTSAPPPNVVDPSVIRWVVAYTVVLTLVALVYEVFFTTRSGATPGKMIMGLRVRLRDRPGPLPVQTAFTRTVIPIMGNLVQAVPLLSTVVFLTQVVDSLLPLANEKKQALHDIMAATNVVDTRR